MRLGTSVFVVLWLILPAVGCGDDDGSGNNNGNANSNSNNNNQAQPQCGNEQVEGTEECDDGVANSDSTPDACRTSCWLPFCGDNVIDSGEACDNGAENSDTSPDACRESCLLPFCGDGIVDVTAGEACDCGADAAHKPAGCSYPNGDPLSTCSVTCAVRYCGNGTVDPGEECDPEDEVTGPTCGPTCLTFRCGNSVIDPGEECDDGSGNSDTEPDACRTGCLLASCGDNVLDQGEVCDDGNLNDHDACTNSCQHARCGDDIRQTSMEVCDGADLSGQDCAALGFTGGTLLCAQDCGRFDVTGCTGGCGNGIVEDSEECDAGTANSDTLADACRTSCFEAGCGDAVTDTGEECDDGSANSNSAPDACRTDCRRAYCGDGVVDTGETCDQGAANSDTVANACRTTCVPASCGDGVVDTGEQCDEGTANSNTLADACRTDCTSHRCGDGTVDTGEGCDDANLVNWDGCSACAIAEFQVNTFTTGEQSYPSAGMASDGSFVVVWQSAGQDGSGYGIFGQRYGILGIATGPEFKVNTSTSGDQRYPATAMASDGRFVVTWVGPQPMEPTYTAKFSQRFTSLGTAAGIEIDLGGCYANRKTLAVSDLTSLTYVVGDVDEDHHICGSYHGWWPSFTWCDENQPQRWEVLTGSSPDPCNNTARTTPVAMTSNGTGVAIFHDGDGTYAARYNASGWLVGQVLTEAWGAAAASMADDGRFVFVSASSEIGLYLYDSQDNPVVSGAMVNQYTTNLQNNPSVAMANDGTFVVTWASVGQDGSGSGVYFRRFSALGAALGNDTRAHVFTQGDQNYPAIAMSGDGHFVIVWQSFAQDGSQNGIYAQCYDPDGTALGVGR